MNTGSSRSWSCTTKPRPASRAASPRRVKAIDRAGHPALFMVDTGILLPRLHRLPPRRMGGSTLTVGCSQKGLMLPPGLGFNAVSAKALAASKKARLTRSYWSWDEMLAANKDGFFPSSPATNLLYGLRESLRLLTEEGRKRLQPSSSSWRSRASGGSDLGASDPLS